jgi:hypothetical protein
MRNPKVIAALAEEGKKILRSGGAGAAKALLALVQDSKHRDHIRAIGMVLARTDPEVQYGVQEVVHKIEDPDIEALEELRAARRLGASRQTLLELFGPNGLDRLERLEVRRAENAKVIDGEVLNDNAR